MKLLFHDVIFLSFKLYRFCSKFCAELGFKASTNKHIALKQQSPPPNYQGSVAGGHLGQYVLFRQAFRLLLGGSVLQFKHFFEQCRYAGKWVFSDFLFFFFNHQKQAV